MGCLEFPNQKVMCAHSERCVNAIAFKHGLEIFEEVNALLGD